MKRCQRGGYKRNGRKCCGKSTHIKKKTLLLTDAYSLADSCCKSRVIKDFIENSKDSLYLVLCGGDAMDVSAYKFFSSLNVVLAEDVLKTMEILMSQQDCSTEEEGW